MKQVVLLGPGVATLADTGLPPRPEGYVLLRTLRVGICGSDLHAFGGTQPFVTYPRILGHELALEVVDPGSFDLNQGERVTVEPYINCGRCYPCRQGRYNCCVDLEVLGIHRDGGLREYIAVPREKVHRAPPEMDVEELALIEPLSVGAHAVERGRIQTGEFVLVIGAGPIGVAAAQVAKSRGATVAIADVVQERLELALKLGADYGCDFTQEDVHGRIAELTGGEGAHVVIEAVGKPETIQDTVSYVASSGRVVVAGLGRDNVHFPQEVFNRKEIDFLGSRNSAQSFPQLVSAVGSGRLTMKPLVSHRVSLSEVPAMLEFMQHHPQGVLKVIVVLR